MVAVSSSFIFILSTYDRVNLVFYTKNFSINRPVVAQLLKMSPSMRKVWGSIPRPVEPNTL